ncbi:MAG TPA: hybrid sensor histidine kinase/response regulator [Epsilonproteobacteria bacterium]|nr:hybrid sensor histidine kinase/response regulator [Campylobacterota bacterium]
MNQKCKNHKRFSILIVDDTVENLRYLSTLLSKHGYSVRASSDPHHAFLATATLNPDLIMLDIKMPNMDGFTFAKRLREETTLTETPIIFISALNDVEDKIKAFEASGVDYITKPFEEKEVLARLDVHLHLHESRQKVATLVEQQDYFIKKIMHEMNTPVSVITLNAQTLEAQEGKNIQLDTIKASAKILSSIYDELGYLVKKELHDYEAEWIKLVEFIGTRIAYFHEVAEIKEIQLHLDVEEEFAVHVNPIHLERVIDNILSNAIKYSNNQTHIEILLAKKHSSYFVSIKDQGVGINDVARIFEQYYQSSQHNVGLGIGLVTVKEICEIYDITLQVESKKQEGSTFTFVFPSSLVRTS